jgi:hypothetical protein
MKKLVLLLVFLLSLSSFSQDVFKFKSRGRVLQNEKIISPTDFRAQFNYNQQIIDLYDAGRNKKTFGNILLYGGLVTIVGKFVYNGTHQPKLIQTAQTSYNYGPYNNTAYIYNYTYEAPPSNALFFVGAGLTLLAIPIKIGFSNKIRQAVALANSDTKKPKTSLIESTSFMANANGIGFSLTF